MRALLRNRDAGLALVQMHDVRVGVFELLGQKNRRVAGAAAGHQRPEAMLKRLPAGKAVVVDHRQVFQPCLHQPLVVVLRIARRVGQGFVLASDLGQVVAWHEGADEDLKK